MPKKHRPFRAGKPPQVGPFTEVKPLPPDAGPVDQVWVDALHTVLVVRFTFAGERWIHLAIRRHDRGKLTDHWATLQKIKDWILGTEATAMEPHPKRSAKVDEGNVYHLYCKPEGAFPFDLSPAKAP